MYKKLIAITLSFVLVLASVGIVPIYAEGNTEANIDPYSKIHFYCNEKEQETVKNVDELREAINAAKLRNSTISVCGGATIEDQQEEKMTVTVEFKSNFFETDQYKSFKAERANISNSDEMLDFRMRLNAYSKSYHEALISENALLLNGLNYDNIEPISYSPFVKANVEESNINEENLGALCFAENVESISISINANTNSEASYATNTNSEASWSNVASAVNAYDYINSNNNRGEGMRVGVFCLDGICDFENEYLADKDITVRNIHSTINNDYTKIMSILLSFVPNASFYVSDVVNGKYDFSWFIENGCDIVHYAFNVPFSSNSYKNYIDGVIDYQVKASFITVCTQTGDIEDNNSEILSPAYAYNAITVGGAHNYYTDFWTTSPTSRYESEPYVKPNVSAPYVVDITGFGVNTSTRYSAAIVTGCITLFMQENPSYCAYPEKIMAVMMSTAKHLSDGIVYGDDYGTIYSFLHPRTGAGLINLGGMLESDEPIEIYNTNRIGDATIYSTTVYLEEGKQIQIGLSWLGSVNAYEIYDNDSGSLIDFTVIDRNSSNYELRIYRSSGLCVDWSELANSNVEFINCGISESGYYRIEVYLKRTMSQYSESEYLYLAYQVTD